MKPLAVKNIKKKLTKYQRTVFYYKLTFHCKILKLSISVSICILKLEKFHIIENIIKHSIFE